MQRLADSVVAVVRAGDSPTLDSHPANRLCPGTRFAGQTPLSNCTGFLVSGDMVATAGHCISARSCHSISFVFGYAVRQPGVMPPLAAPPGETYACKEVLARSYPPESRGDDFALVRLNRPVTGHTPLQLDLTGLIPSEGTPVFTIGHPLGLPVKIADSAFVRVSTSVAEASGLRWFTTTLDSFPGNSGGPVFNARTYLVEGIDVRQGSHESRHFDTTPEGCLVPHISSKLIMWGPEVASIGVLLQDFRRHTGRP